MERRSFIKRSGILAAGVSLSRAIPVAGPFKPEDFSEGMAPPDKRLNPEWVRSLYKRGSATTYRKSKDELRYIGMPVGGICCGTVYVGGDGRLFVWDIFNENQLGAVFKELPISLETFNVREINNVFGTLYLEPVKEISRLQQGFAVLIKHNSGTVMKRLHVDDWEEISFEATYPVATIRYSDKAFPLELTLQAFSPFIPGDAHNSGLPATIQSVRIHNKGTEPLSVELVGWLENKLMLNTGKHKRNYSLQNKKTESSHCKAVLMDCDTADAEIRKAPDFGSLAFTTLAPDAEIFADASAAGADLDIVKDLLNLVANPVALIRSRHSLKPGASTRADFIISWYTPNISFDEKGQGMTVQGADFHYYTKQFSNAFEVSDYIAQHYKQLRSKTLLWKETWYDSTLPWWFLERTFLNISTLATSTSHRFKSGRFYAWEGVGCCHGTCTHVYQYAHAMSRIFPELERDERERVDLGVGYDAATGMIRYRGENTGPAIDGQAGTVLRIYREYLMSADGRILKDYWDKIKMAVVFIMKQDKNQDGMEDTPMENTLDAVWSGEISWIVGLCIAAVYAGQRMAEEMNDADFAKACREYVEKGRKNMEDLLFNGEYFIHRPDPKVGKKEIGSYNTCHIDQVYGQSWAWQVGLGRMLDREKTLSALRALWKYNYMPDVGPYIKVHKGGRFYAVAGEGGMVMNTNPRNDDKPYGEAKAWQIGYFSECMTGFEHQVASHMMAEGMIEESLVLTRTIHDRYHARKRNPFNEIECSDHYGRAMASYATFLSACGFEYNGPKGYIRFAPKWNETDFKAPFTVAEGWGTYSQKKSKNGQVHTLLLKEGSLALEKISLQKTGQQPVKKITGILGNQPVKIRFTQDGQDLVLQFDGLKTIQRNSPLKIVIQ